jgi:hypothetical protein
MFILSHLKEKTMFNETQFESATALSDAELEVVALLDGEEETTEESVEEELLDDDAEAEGEEEEMEEGDDEDLEEEGDDEAASDDASDEQAEG